MIITVVPADRTVICDGKAHQLKPWPFDDKEIHAIQWQHTQGEIEHKTFPRIPNTIFDDYSIVEPYVDAFNAVDPPSEQAP